MPAIFSVSGTKAEQSRPIIIKIIPAISVGALPKRPAREPNQVELNVPTK